MIYKYKICSSRCLCKYTVIDYACRGIHADIIVYIFAHLHTALHTAGSKLDIPKLTPSR